MFTPNCYSSCPVIVVFAMLYDSDTVNIKCVQARDTSPDVSGRNHQCRVRQAAQSVGKTYLNTFLDISEFLKFVFQAFCIFRV